MNDIEHIRYFLKRMKSSKTKKLIIIVAVVLAAGVLFLSIPGIMKWLYSQQYNANGISHFLVITIDEDQPRRFIADLDGRKVYMERLDPEGTCFRSVNAENVSVKKAVSDNKTSVDEWRKYAWSIKTYETGEVLKFENYEIAVTDDECIIRPISNKFAPVKTNEPSVKNTITGDFGTYYEMDDGTWMYEGRSYKYRLEISGKMHSAAKESTFIYLSNIEDISFDRAVMASGLSSNMADYFSPEEAVFVGWKNN